MTAPALDKIGAELNITSSFEKALSLSIFVLGEFLCDLVISWISANIISAYAIGTS